LIAAAGNAGPKSPPLYPGADPNVIAVTATDADDKIFSGANRGRYVSVSAPGVDILVPAPEGAYQLTTGTSVAAAEVSGVAALLLERNPRLTPADISAFSPPAPNGWRPATATTTSAPAWSIRLRHCSRPIQGQRPRCRRGDRQFSESRVPIRRGNSAARQFAVSVYQTMERDALPTPGSRSLTQRTTDTSKFLLPIHPGGVGQELELSDLTGRHRAGSLAEKGSAAARGRRLSH
jgi:subtilisin family serine protease